MKFAVVDNSVADTAKNAVVAYYNDNYPTNKIGVDDVAIVWSCYILGNWKVLATTNIQDGMYYEITCDAFLRGKIYIDAYKRWKNVEFDLVQNDGSFFSCCHSMAKEIE